MGADKILAQLRKAEAHLKKAQDSAKTFFQKKASKEKKELNSYRFNHDDDRLSVSDCEEQLRDWAQELVEREIRRRPEGEKLKQLEQLQQHSIDTVMEAGTPDELIRKLDTSTKKIGIAWVVDTSKVKQIAS
jgi:hypothetical protein